jgi:hypothetical protein
VSSNRGRRRNTKRRTPVRPEHRAFARGLLSLLPPTGFLLFVTVRPPPTVRIPKLHLTTARFFASHGCDYVAAMDWEKYKVHSRRQVGESEHVHSIVWLPAPEFQPFCRALYAWAEKHGILAKAVDVQLIHGWPRYLGVGDRDELAQNVAQTFRYAMKPPKDGRTRSLDADVAARGIFLASWKEFVAATKTNDPTPVERACKYCRRPLLEGTARREHCDDVCRRKYNRLLKRTSYRFVFKNGDVYMHRRVRPRQRPGRATRRIWSIS